MEEILAFIEKKKLEFSQLPFFEYLRDQNISPKQRLAFAPCAAPFIMSFGELNRTVFRDEPTSDPIQKIINKHTYEEDCHWLWFLEDLEKLRLNPSKPFTETLKFLWGEKTRAARQTAYELYRHAANAIPTQKLVIIQSVEATSDTFLEVSSEIIRELNIFTDKQEYQFFGTSHLIVETGHTFNSPKITQLINNIQLSEEEKKASFTLIRHIFSVFAEFVDELLTYAKAHQLDQTLYPSVAQHVQNFKPIGSYLIEAGLLKTEQLQEALTQQKLTPIPLGQILASKGWVNQQTTEFLMKKVISSERQLTDTENLSSIYQKQIERMNDSNSSSIALKQSVKPIYLGTYLIEAALVSDEQIHAALDEQKVCATPIGQILSRNGLVNQKTIEYLMEKVILPERKTAVLSQ
jgi:hypothetical protein